MGLRESGRAAQSVLRKNGSKSDDDRKLLSVYMRDCMDAIYEHAVKQGRYLFRIAEMDRENLVSETMYQFLHKCILLAQDDKIHFERSEEQIRAFLREVAKNIFRDLVRKTAKSAARMVTGQSIRLEATETPGGTDTDTIKLIQELETLLARLPEKDGQAIKLRYLDKLEFAEIAESLNISEATARKRVSRALKVLQRLARGSS